MITSSKIERTLVQASRTRFLLFSGFVTTLTLYACYVIFLSLGFCKIRVGLAVYTALWGRQRGRVQRPWAVGADRSVPTATGPVTLGGSRRPHSPSPLVCNRDGKPRHPALLQRLKPFMEDGAQSQLPVLQGPRAPSLPEVRLWLEDTVDRWRCPRSQIALDWRPVTPDTLMTWGENGTVQWWGRIQTPFTESPMTRRNITCLLHYTWDAQVIKKCWWRNESINQSIS